MVKAFTIILIVVVAALSGTGAVAAASQSSLPDQALYSVKIWTEDLRIGLASASAEDTLNLALDFASRRVTEISTLTDQGVITPDSVATRLEIEIYQLTKQSPSCRAMRSPKLCYAPKRPYARRKKPCCA